MGKSRRMSGNDIELLEKLKRENRELKRRLKVALKIHDRIDYDHLNKFIEAQEADGIDLDEETRIKYKSKTACKKEDRKCFKCKDGYLELIIIRKPLNQWVYFRRCDKCDNRTATQPYTPDVKE